MPVPVVAAALIFPLASAIQAVQLIIASTSEPTETRARLFAVVLVGLSLAIAYGLRRRMWRARLFAICASGVSIAYSLLGLVGSGPLSLLKILGYAAVAALLLAPASAREWFPNGARRSDPGRTARPRG
ncbi:hypothetical protein SAMN05443287_112161 [Micromonospora phaseoli]|uniref:Uncharacterized protein n=1 Tax=Micromonospora phaseoli TaxID=1144548 RepID=A0A1H7DKM9_9ACTN|nr:hypothetical protein CLV64_112162 [Micromonospora phaseoli]GIJ77390.1 hypothetical protein Xph01_18220 [Micromonospora phaseoli]SEJ98775.1 hypothetical protein SAMN05443287_112161 [Micromonospora phaseoli]